METAEQQGGGEQESNGTGLWGRFSALESTLTPGQAQRVSSVPKRYFKLFARALLGATNSRSAIKAYCQQCVGWAGLPDEVRDCTARACPLWSYRPYRPK